MAIDLRLDPQETPLLIDLYHLTMAAGFFEHGFNDESCFAMWIRRMPASRGFLVAAGLERFLETLEEFHFDAAALDYFDSLKLFKPEFLHFLSGLRFTGEVRAMPEGTIFFPEEPVIEVRAPLLEAQFLEALALNQIGMASLIASKAARCYNAARGRRLVDFGLRRSQGADASLIAARSSYLAGFDGSASVLAGKRYGIPLFGTMAHSFIMVHDTEREGYANFARSFPHLSTLLVDTYDTLRGVENAATVARELEREGIQVQAVRLDSGDPLELSRKARRMLDDRGLHKVAIFASGNLDEYKIDALMRAGAPIDGFGVGSSLVTSNDLPALDAVYKLVEYRGKPRLKCSTDKVTLPGSKQVFRGADAAGRFLGDILGLSEESAHGVAQSFKPAPTHVEPLLTTQMRKGRRVLPRPSLADARQLFLDSWSRLEERFKGLQRPDTYPVWQSAALKATVIEQRLQIPARQA
jgi:nicotinate phosphoribosyltransferase